MMKWFLLVVCLVFPVWADSYHQWVVYGMDVAKCEEVGLHWEEASLSAGAAFLVECDPNLGFLRISIGSGSIASEIASVDSWVLARFGKAADVSMSIAKGTRLTTSRDAR